MNEKMGSDSPHVDEGTIHAWLDGALSDHESSAVQVHVAACGACSAAVAEARGFIAASTRILSALDDVPGDVIPRADTASRVLEMGTRQRRSRLATNMRRYAPIAAIAVLGIATTLIIREQPPRELVPGSAPPLARSTNATGAPAAKAKTLVAAGATPHQHGKSVDRRASEHVPPAIAGRVAEAPRPIPVAPSPGATDATAPMIAAAQSRAAVAAPRAVVSQLLTGASTIDSARAGDLLTVAGASVAPTAEEFTKSPPSIDGARVVSSEVSDVENARVRHTVYELGSGTQITLVERRLRTDALHTARPGTTVVEAQKSTQESHAVSWTASDGTVLILSGAVPAGQLEALKSQLVAASATPRP